MENEIICPKCGAIRYNAGKVISQKDYKEIYLFCRQCETEFVIRIEEGFEKDKVE